jgi:transposase
MSIDEAAARFGVSRSAIHNLRTEYKLGKLPGARIEGMKWTPDQQQLEQIGAMSVAEAAACFGVTKRRIYGVRSAYGLSTPRVARVERRTWTPEQLEQVAAMSVEEAATCFDVTREAIYKIKSKHGLRAPRAAKEKPQEATGEKPTKATDEKPPRAAKKKPAKATEENPPKADGDGDGDGRRPRNALEGFLL